MKAIKNSLEARNPWKFKDDEVVLAYGMMTSLQVHVTGYVTHVDENGFVRGKQVTVRKGNGPETYYKNLGIIKKERLVEDTCNRIYNAYVTGTKLNADGTEVGSEAPRQAVVFHDRRNDVPNERKGKKKSFYKTNATQATTKAS